jgi:DNA helicase HerA-like ATPase
MTIQLIGEGQRRGNFSRGVSQYPTIGDQVHLVTEQDLVRIYGRPEEPNFVKVGHLASAESIPALIDIDKLITRHSAVVGATGAGKSTTVAGLLVSLSDKSLYPSARIIVLDIHGEYSAALKDRATVFRINPKKKNKERPLYIPYWAMTFDELLSVTLGSLDDVSRGAILEKMTELKRSALAETNRAGVTESNLTVDTPVPFSIHQMWFELHCEMMATHYEKKGYEQSQKTWALELDKQGNPIQLGDALKVIPPKFRGVKDIKDDPEKIRLSKSALNIRRPLEGLASKLRDPRFDFLFRPGIWHPTVNGQTDEDIDSLLELDLSGIPPSVLTDLIGVLLRIIYDSLFWSRNLSEGGRERPLLLVLEEAHAYLGKGDAGQAALAVRRIAKEGRKYGIGAMIVSQRPAEIDTTILSQCGTIFAMRLSNTIDRAHVTGAATDNLEGLLSMLPVLKTGEAIIIGEAVHLPVRTLIDPPPKERRPDSSDPLVYTPTGPDGPIGPGGWNRNREKGDYAEVVAVWRKQEPRSPRIIIETEEEVINK